MNKEQYQRYLKSDYWLALSERVKLAAMNRCQLCFSGIRLNAHHRSYRNVGIPELEILDLICLCQDCHHYFHRGRKLVQQVPAGYKNWGFGKQKRAPGF